MMRKLTTLVSFTCLGSGLAAAAPVDYKTQIAPLMSSKCNDCHTGKKRETDKKPKAGLALDTPAGMRSGGVITPGDHSSSEIWVRCVLPPTDDEIMPPVDDGGPLSKKEIDLIKRWVDEGAKFSSASGGGLKTLDPKLDARAVLAMRAGEPNSDAVIHLEDLGAAVSALAVALPQYLVVEFISTYHKTTDKEIEQILHIAPNVVEVDLSRTQVTDAGLQHIGKLGRLTHLNLNRTEVTDSGIKHLAGLRSLEWLNLYGTKVTDACLPDLAKHKKLTALYIWNTAITDAGADKLRKALPKTKIVRETDIKASRLDDLDAPLEF